MGNVSVKKYGRWQQRDLCEITLTNRHGVEAVILNYGATLEKFQTSGEKGPHNWILSLPEAADYHQERNFLGGTVGRIIGRMSQGLWEFGGIKRQFILNDGSNHAHGGLEGLDTQVFAFAVAASEDAASVRLTIVDPAGHNGYPGNLKLIVTYTLTDDNRLTYHLDAVTDEMTLCNPANHVYFNLDEGGEIGQHRLTVAASSYLPLDATSIPNIGRVPVDDSIFDLRHGRLLSEVLESDNPQIIAEDGLNHPFILDGAPVAAELLSGDQQRRVTLRTTAPSVVVYTANHFRHTGFAANIGRHEGVALEAQFPPSDDPSLQPIILLPGEHFRSETSWTLDF